MLAFLTLTRHFANIIFLLELVSLEQDLDPGTEFDKDDSRIILPFLPPLRKFTQFQH